MRADLKMRNARWGFHIFSVSLLYEQNRKVIARPAYKQFVSMFVSCVKWT